MRWVKNGCKEAHLVGKFFCLNVGPMQLEFGSYPITVGLLATAVETNLGEGEKFHEHA